MPSDLTQKQIESFLGTHPDWFLNEHAISRTYGFDDFMGSLRFVMKIGAAAEAADHHPDIDIRWNEVTVTLSTHSEGALTSKDLDLAATFDTL
jgi:4a-hydroxytetrahydrobiopterin dehydratase